MTTEKTIFTVERETYDYLTNKGKQEERKRILQILDSLHCDCGDCQLGNMTLKIAKAKINSDVHKKGCGKEVTGDNHKYIKRYTCGKDYLCPECKAKENRA